MSARRTGVVATALLAALLLPSGCAAVKAHGLSGSGEKSFAASKLDLTYASVPFLLASEDADVPPLLWLTSLFVPLALLDLPFSFLSDLAVEVPELLRAPARLPKTLGSG